jgi:hypothetical protein
MERTRFGRARGSAQAVRSLSPGQPGQCGPQGRLVALDLDLDQVVATAGMQGGRVGALAVQGIGGDDDAAQVGQAVQHRSEGGELVATGHRGLAEHQSIGVVVGGDQLNLGAVGAAGSAQHLAVDGHRLPLLADRARTIPALGASEGAPAKDPGGQRRLQRHRIDRGRSGSRQPPSGTRRRHARGDPDG